MIVCHSNIIKITRSINLPESEKSRQLLEAEQHLKLAKMERDLYNVECIQATEELKANPLNPTIDHISFDFAQQIHFPIVVLNQLDHFIF